jgi:hypothetical protein
MKQGSKIAMAAGATLIGSWASSADTLQTHRIPAVLALEAVGEAVATCAQQGYRENGDGARHRWRYNRDIARRWRWHPHPR